LFQSNTSNQNTIIGIVPQSNSQRSAIELYNNSDLTSFSSGILDCSSNQITLNSTNTGSGSLLPIAIQMNSVSGITLNTSNIVNFTNVPTCTTSATTTNQLVNYNNFVQSTFTPVLFGGGTTGTSYNIQSGRFTRINNWCTFEAEILLSTKGGLSSGSITASIPVPNDSISKSALTIGRIIGIGPTGGYINASMWVDTGASVGTLVFRTTANQVNPSNVTLNDIDPAFNIVYGGSYICS
jgi:hypothetical protein